VIRKSVYLFSETIMCKQELKRDVSRFLGEIGS